MNNVILAWYGNITNGKTSETVPFYPQWIVKNSLVSLPDIMGFGIDQKYLQPLEGLVLLSYIISADKKHVSGVVAVYTLPNLISSLLCSRSPVRLVFAHILPHRSSKKLQLMTK